MRKLWYLSTCSTCKRIIKELGGLKDFEKQDLKEQPVSAGELDMLAGLAGSYEALINRRSTKYREWELKDKIKSEQDYRHWILQHYTLLKRPVILTGQVLFAGNSPADVSAAKKYLLDR